MTDKKKVKKTRPFTLQSFPDALYWQIKVYAALKHMPMKTYVIAALEEAIDRDSDLWTPTQGKVRGVSSR